MSIVSYYISDIFFHIFWYGLYAPCSIVIVVLEPHLQSGYMEFLKIKNLTSTGVCVLVNSSFITLV